MTSDTEWTWKVTETAADQFDALDPHVQDRITSKLEEVVSSEWRSPTEYVEPITGSPFSKLRVGEYRLGCIVNRQTQVLEIHRIRHRGGAYTADD